LIHMEIIICELRLRWPVTWPTAGQTGSRKQSRGCYLSRGNRSR
jgi:hypothetical protein